MTENRNENIDELLAKFFAPGQTEQVKRDLSDAERLFAEFPVPNPSLSVIEEIKQKINRRQKPVAFTAILAKTAVAAAVVVIVSAFLLQDIHREKSAEQSQNVSTASLTQVDTTIAALEKEAELLSGEFRAVSLNEDNGTSSLLSDSVGNVENEILDTELSFWKG